MHHTRNDIIETPIWWAKSCCFRVSSNQWLIEVPQRIDEIRKSVTNWKSSAVIFLLYKYIHLCLKFFFKSQLSLSLSLYNINNIHKHKFVHKAHKGTRMERDSSTWLEKDICAHLEGDSSTCLERYSSTRMETDMGTGVDKGKTFLSHETNIMLFNIGYVRI